MHRSRLAGFIIDCKADDLEVAAEFWSAALGYERTDEDDADGIYAALRTPDNEPYLSIQKVSHESRVHLDIETDDKEAEVRRLEALGARRVGEVKTWIVMEAPTGQRFCIVNKGHRYFDETANTWD